MPAGTRIVLKEKNCTAQGLAMSLRFCAITFVRILKWTACGSIYGADAKTVESKNLEVILIFLNKCPLRIPLQSSRTSLRSLFRTRENVLFSSWLGLRRATCYIRY